jgi:fluoride exporter
MILMMLLVFVGGAVGTLCRLWLSTWIARWAGSRFPWGTLTVNVVGSFLIGLILEWPDVVRHAAGSGFWVALLAVGFCAGLTTFSSFSLQTFRAATGEALGSSRRKHRSFHHLVRSGSRGWS